MITHQPSSQPTVPKHITAKVGGQTVRLTRERGQETGIPYWVVTIGETRYAGWPASLQDTEASLLEQLARWAESHPAALRQGRAAPRP